MRLRTDTKILRLVLLTIMIAGTGIAQEFDVPVLTLDQAIGQAIANNSELKSSSLETLRAADELAATRTRRFASTQVVALGSQLLTKPSITFQQGSLGVYPSVGPIPATDKTINIARRPVGAVLATVNQPLSTQYKLHLQLKALALGVEVTQQDRDQTRLQVVDQVRSAYYTVARAQSALDSLEASLPFYEESKRLATVNLKRETILESDFLRADTQLLNTQNAITDASDQVAAAIEKLNDLMGRDIHVRFRVATVISADAEAESTEALESRALHDRPDVKKANLQVQQAHFDARAKKAEYIPDVSLAFNYLTTANFQNALPANITAVGLQLTWEPWDWGRKRHELAEKQVKEEQAKVGVSETERSILLQVRSASRQLNSTRRQLTLTEATERAARQKLKEVQEQLKRESVLNKDLFSAQSELATADSQQQQALAAFWKARADLKKAIGEQ